MRVLNRNFAKNTGGTPHFFSFKVSPVHGIFHSGTSCWRNFGTIQWEHGIHSGCCGRRQRRTGDGSRFCLKVNHSQHAALSAMKGPFAANETSHKLMQSNGVGPALTRIRIFTNFSCCQFIRRCPQVCKRLSKFFLMDHILPASAFSTRYSFSSAWVLPSRCIFGSLALPTGVNHVGNCHRGGQI